LGGNGKWTGIREAERRGRKNYRAGSAWDQAEQNKDAAALAGLLADKLVYVDYDGTLSNKQQLLESIKSAAVSSEQINNEGVKVQLYNDNVAVSTGIYRTRAWRRANCFRGVDVSRTCGSSKRRLAMYC